MLSSAVLQSWLLDAVLDTLPTVVQLCCCALLIQAAGRRRCIRLRCLAGFTPSMRWWRSCSGTCASASWCWSRRCRAAEVRALETHRPTAMTIDGTTASMCRRHGCRACTRRLRTRSCASPPACLGWASGARFAPGARAWTAVAHSESDNAHSCLHHAERYLRVRLEGLLQGEGAGSPADFTLPSLTPSGGLFFFFVSEGLPRAFLQPG